MDKPLKKNTYLDFAATSPVEERVINVMLPYFRDDFGNSSSIHQWGQRSENALENARISVAKTINCKPTEIIFTGGGSESDNLAIKGTALARRRLNGANKILISPVEHPAVTETARQLKEVFDFEMEYLKVDEYGRVNLVDLENRINPEVALVSIIYGNNEIGTINPIQQLAGICRQALVPFHTDAVQAVAQLQMDVNRDQIDLLSLGAHKFYGPKGVGALFVRSGTPIIPIQTGGKQEFGLRAGTHNTPYIVGLAEALTITNENMGRYHEMIIPMRNYLIDSILTSIPNSKLTGHPSHRLANHTSFVFEGLDGNELLVMLDQHGFACSSGSACKVGNPKPSEVLLNIGLAPEWASGSLRVTLGRTTTMEEITSFIQILPGIVKSLRK
jgi:cysteine desulfurase